MYIMRFIYISLLCLIFLPVCEKRADVNIISAEDVAVVVVDVGEDEIETVDPARLRAREIAFSLDDSLLTAQVLICGIDGKESLPSYMAQILEEHPPGGIILFRYNLDADNDSIRAFLSETVSLVTGITGISPFIAVDHEGGGVYRFRRGVAMLPEASSYWDYSLEEGRGAALIKIEIDSIKAGREIKSLGINMNFAPVAEYLNDNNRDFLKYRSYGPDPAFAADAAAVFVRGMELAGVLSVIKHFPGSAGDDPHFSPSVIKEDNDALAALISPFKTIIDKDGARALMVAHSLVPALDSEIASLSPVVMGQWLREELAFNGLIICDDFSMAAAGDLTPETAAIRSIAAGADMILVWPPDIRRTHGAFIAALEDGRLSRERVREAAARVIYEKLRMSLAE